MAGMEQLEIHSKSYLIRWVNASGDHTISWSVQPHKKSINFGIFKRPGALGSITPNLSATSTFEVAPTPIVDGNSIKSKKSVSSRNESSTAADTLKSKGLMSIFWFGRCEADQVSMGKYDVPTDQGGDYALVFDNTFSKQLSKTATFILLTYPTNSAPQTSHHMRHLFAADTGSAGAKRSPKLKPERNDSVDSLTFKGDVPMKLSKTQTSSLQGSLGSDFYTGVLRKRRRKRHQGFARRFFSLDFTSSTMSYYHSRHSSALRGAIPLSLAAVAANEQTREICIDSGAEVWHLKANSRKEFDGWRDALEEASRSAASGPGASDAITIQTSGASFKINAAEDKEWARVETLVGRVSGTRDAVRRLAKDTDPKYLPPPPSLGISSTDASPLELNGNDYFNEEERRPFWRRKSSVARSNPAGFRRSLSGQLAVPSPPKSGTPLTRPIAIPAKSGQDHGEDEEGMHGHCMALLHDLDAVLSDFAQLLNESKQRRLSIPVAAARRTSVDSTSSQEFFDADGGDIQTSQLLMIHPESSEEGIDKPEEDFASDETDTVSSSDNEGTERFERSPTIDADGPSLFPRKPKSLLPLPHDAVSRRNNVPASTVLPPSLIGILRKNVGKDLSTISMPVSTNEPTSLLQRAAEQLEYTALLDAAVSADAANGERLLYITAFAISVFSNARVKERAIRKPFNPMLGETFELVREDRGFRFLAEKISHRPVQLACQAEAKEWTLTQSPLPTQKFWGKSAELITDGRVRVVLHATGEHFSWSTANCFLRNIIAGEKYVEPVGTMTVLNETTGEKAVVTFKTKGMFSGRSEEVVVQAFASHAEGSHLEALPLGLEGKWTSHLNLTEHGRTLNTVWNAGDVVDNAPSHYGFTNFAASLNQITSIEEGKIPKSDSRLRPDQRATENADLDHAETLKTKLEEAQRTRRKIMEEQGTIWKPRWFEKVEHEGEEVWSLRTGRECYWEERTRGDWEGVPEIFDV
ncbi:MAG: hypothetical protein M1827_003655 [Pycnora praestabilis]|nr:MAG: hypothetical protein M1827_003655 [Pycnora praestabilis]